MGYDLQEIVGQHHRMFCEPAYVQTGRMCSSGNSCDLANWTAANTCAWASGSRPPTTPFLTRRVQPFKVVKFETDPARRAMEQELRTAKEPPSRLPPRAAPSWPT